MTETNTFYVIGSKKDGKYIKYDGEYTTNIIEAKWFTELVKAKEIYYPDFGERIIMISVSVTVVGEI